MSAIYNHGQKFGMIPRTEESNPMKWVSATTISDYEAVSLSPEDSFAILDRIADPLVRLLVILVAVTAVRIGEALALRWSDIDWKRKRINVRHSWVDGELGRPKSRASKAPVEMHETLANLLQSWRQQTHTARTWISCFRHSSCTASSLGLAAWSCRTTSDLRL